MTRCADFLASGHGFRAPVLPRRAWAAALATVFALAACGGGETDPVDGSKRAQAAAKPGGSTPAARQLFGQTVAQDSADLNGDGKADLLWYSADTGETAAWLMDGASMIGGGALLRHPHYQVIGAADLNGDGKSDLVWHDDTTGETSAWLMNGSQYTGGQLLMKDLGFKVIGAPDLNGDGKSDLLWRNDATGQTAAWLMDGTRLIGGGVLLTDAAFRVVALPDLNGDGKTDLVWFNDSTGQSVAWLMNGAAPAAGVTLLTNPSFRVTAAADLNGDGQSDLLWHNKTTGQTVAWLMNGLAFIGGGQLLADVNFEVVGTPDLNGDGKSDLLWYSAAAGQTVAWLMDGTRLVGGGALTADAGLVVVGARDLNGDGKTDLVWHDVSTSVVRAWLMDGAARTLDAPILAGTAFTLSSAAGYPGLSLRPTAVDTRNRAQVAAFYRTHYLASEGVDAGWTGNQAHCNPGSTSPAFKQAILRRINYFRAMAGVPSISGLSDDYNSKAQAAALMMGAERALDHFPGTNWACYRADGAAGAGNSNLYLGVFGPSAISGYILDPGGNNYPVGHRRWIMYPQTRFMGSGDIPPAAGTAPANALWVLDGPNLWSKRPETREAYVAWPPPGHVPYQVVYPRWSFSFPLADFSGATVTMRRNGVPLSVVLSPVVNGYGENTLVWEPADSFGGAPDADVSYEVSLNNVGVKGSPRSFSYRVNLINPGR